MLEYKPVHRIEAGITIEIWLRASNPLYAFAIVGAIVAFAVVSRVVLLPFLE